MITTHIIHPVSPGGMVYMVEITEHLCRKYCQNASVLPTGAVSFEVGPTTIINGVAKATVTAHVSTMTPVCQTCGCASPQVFTERFDVAFSSAEGSTITIAQGEQTIVEPAYKGCCYARGIKLTTTVEATITA